MAMHSSAAPGFSIYSYHQFSVMGEIWQAPALNAQGAFSHSAAIFTGANGPFQGPPASHNTHGIEAMRSLHCHRHGTIPRNCLSVCKRPLSTG